MKKVAHAVTFKVAGVPYIVEFGNDYSVSFRLLEPPLDWFGHHVDDYERVSTPPHIALKVFRKVIEITLNYIKKYKPPYVYYNTAGDDSRESLYLLLAKKLKREGYTLAFDEHIPERFYVYKDV